jgi:anthranilate phosphoribosyltransferase
MSRTDFHPYLEHVQSGNSLDTEQASRAFDAIMSGQVAEDDLADFLLAIAGRQPAIPEIVGAASAMRAKMLTLDAPPGAIDLCGTGGDGLATLNVATAVSFTVAACGVPVAKHGNRSASSRAGAADVLEILGVRVSLPPEAASRCLHETGTCFLFAQTYHPAMKHVAPVRKQLGVRTIFNLLGPICNPARVKRQLIGVYAQEWIEPVAEVLRALGAEKAWVVHGSDGLDELTTTGVTHVAVLESGKISRHEVLPEDAGVPRAALAALKGGDAKDNAAALLRLLEGEHGAFRDIVLLNAAAALVVADKVNNLKAGALMAADAIDSGAARRILSRVVALSRKEAA